MLIGHPSEFAIECCGLEGVNGIFFGSLVIWVYNHQLGSGESIILSVVTPDLVDVLLKSKDRQNANLQDVDACDALERVWSSAYGDEDDGPTAYSTEDGSLYRPCLWFDPSPGFESVRSIIVEVPSGYRIIWQNDGSDQVQDFTVKTEVCRGVIEAFLSWFEDQTGHIHRPYPKAPNSHQAFKAGRRAEAERNREAKSKGRSQS